MPTHDGLTPTLGRTSGLLLVGHGTTDRSGIGEFNEFAAAVAARLHPAPLEAGFLEHARPDVETACLRLFERGVQHVVAQPMLLFSAGHARRDLPERLRQAHLRCDGMTSVQLPTFDCQEEILRFSANRYREAVGVPDSLSGGYSTLILVGRGSHDTDALAMMRRFAGELQQRIECQRVEVAYCGMASPSLPEAISEIAKFATRQVIVQPHLLFRGRLLAKIKREISVARKRHPEIRWIEAQHLGPAKLLVDAVVHSWVDHGLRNVTLSSV